MRRVQTPERALRALRDAYGAGHREHGDARGRAPSGCSAAASRTRSGTCRSAGGARRRRSARSSPASSEWPLTERGPLGPRPRARTATPARRRRRDLAPPRRDRGPGGPLPGPRSRLVQRDAAQRPPRPPARLRRGDVLRLGETEHPRALVGELDADRGRVERRGVERVLAAAAGDRQRVERLRRGRR